MRNFSMPKIMFTCIILFLFMGQVFAQNPSAIMDLESSTQGFLMPRMTTLDREAIASPAQGLQVFDTDTGTIWYFDDEWNELFLSKFEIANSSTPGKTFPPTILDSIEIVGLTGAVDINSKIKVCVDITHPYLSDIDMYLVAPDGLTKLELSTDNGSSLDDYTNTCFTMEATLSIFDGSAPYTGDFRPEGNFSILEGQSVSGFWALELIDDVPDYDDGTLNTWSISIENTNSSSQNYGLSSISYLSNWEDYGLGYLPGNFYKLNNRVYLDGLTRKTGSALAADDIIFVLPAEYRPKGRVILHANQSAAAIRVDIFPNGNVVLVYVDPSAVGDWVNLSGMNFSIR